MYLGWTLSPNHEIHTKQPCRLPPAARQLRPTAMPLLKQNMVHVATPFKLFFSLPKTTRLVKKNHMFLTPNYYLKSIPSGKPDSKPLRYIQNNHANLKVMVVLYVSRPGA